MCVAPGRTVTVDDVLRSAHAMLQVPLTHSEWADCSREEMYTVSRAYTHRMRKQKHEDHVEGARRVDFLGEKHYFAGVKKVKDDEFDVLVKAKK